MGKSIHFSGQPVYGQLIDLLSKDAAARIGRQNGGEMYVKKFDTWQCALPRKSDSWQLDEKLLICTDCEKEVSH